MGFDNESYLEAQTSAILQRVSRFDNKLYLEFGGKLLYDYHASRVLPGFDPNIKMRLMQHLSDKADLLLCIYAGDIERRKIRGDFGITYDVDALKLIDDLRDWNISVAGVIITRYDEQPAARVFRNRLERHDIRVYTHRATRGYPADVDQIVSENGYGANEFIETEKPLVFVTGPGPGSGKMTTCLSQLYHENLRGVSAGYAKFETFPIWDLPLKHPVNVAYEAATADIGDYNVIDPFHLEAYNERAVNYNRDVEAFPVLRRILARIMDDGDIYKSPTEMGVNCASAGIIDEEAVREAARQEVIRRYFRYSCEHTMGIAEPETIERIALLMEDLELVAEDRRVVGPAREAASEAQDTGKGNNGIYCGAAIELKDGTIITGKNSPLMHAASSLVLNAIKHLAGVPDNIHLLSPTVIEWVDRLKEKILSSRTVSLDLGETFIALSICAATNPTAEAAMEMLPELSGCDVHITHMPTPGDEAGLRRLGVHLTSEPNFSTKSLFEP